MLAHALILQHLTLQLEVMKSRSLLVIYDLLLVINQWQQPVTDKETVQQKGSKQTKKKQNNNEKRKTMTKEKYSRSGQRCY